MTTGLSRIPTATLEHLLAAFEAKRLECPFNAADLADAGVAGPVSDIVDALVGVDARGAVAAIRVAIAERLHRPPPRIDLVWTGPETKASVSRSTGIVVQQLFASARASIIIGGYAFDTPGILQPVHRAMVEHGVSAMIFMDVPGQAESDVGAEALATDAIDTFFRDVWTFGLPKPEVFYDPRTARRGPPWASLHAKCIVVDDERALVTSANFTDRGQTRNIEAGVLIEDKGFAEELAAQWRQLVVGGLVRKYGG
ncbi:MAG TPA: DISARM system phospholipase D-like protein DrmC [Polyangiaceae bacterium]